MSSGEQKIALVTGAGRRIGAAIARQLHTRGYRLILHYRNSAAETAELAASLDAAGEGSAALLQADFEAPDQPEKMAQALVREFGRLDLLVNNASLFTPSSLGSVSPAEWDQLMASNLRAPFFLCQALQPLLSEHGGNIVNLLDIHGQRPLRGYSVYCIAKAGLQMMTRSLAREMAPAVRVNGVAPGSILWPEDGIDETARKTIIERTALKRRGDPADIAAAVAYLALDAPYVTGEIITVDGGRSLNM